MPRIKLTLEYDGTHYVGWQIQDNGPTVQGRLQRALADLVGESVTVTGAGRTDSGVHAAGQVAHFDSPRALPLKAYWMGLNGLLPDDIAVVAAEEVSGTFDARRWARGKRYRYRVGNRRARSPLRRFTHWEIFQPLDVEAMRRGAQVLAGEHDFHSFRAADCQSPNSVRKLTRIDVSGAAGDEVVIDVQGTAFLKHMVRNIVGSLAEVGRGKEPWSWIEHVLHAKDRTQAGVTAPPQGLTLMEVMYGDGPRSDDPGEE